MTAPMTCDLCRKPFVPSKYTPNKQRFCDRACQVTALHERQRRAGRSGA